MPPLFVMAAWGDGGVGVSAASSEQTLKGLFCEDKMSHVTGGRAGFSCAALQFFA